MEEIKGARERLIQALVSQQEQKALQIACEYLDTEGQNGIREVCDSAVRITIEHLDQCARLLALLGPGSEGALSQAMAIQAYLDRKFSGIQALSARIIALSQQGQSHAVHRLSANRF